MAPDSPACSFIHASMAGSRSTAPLNRSNSDLIVTPLFSFEISEQKLDGLLELGVVPFAHGLGIEFHFDVRRDAIVFDFPFVVGSPETAARSGNDTTVHEIFAGAEESHEAAPGALTNEEANLGLAEMPRHGVATGAGVFIDDHHL